MRKPLLLLWTALLLSAPLLLFAQRTVTGTVRDDKGAPLTAVSVVEKGTSIGTVTNDRGEYSITVRGANPTLVFSYAGMQTFEQRVGTGNTVSVSLQPGGQMSEVVVTALGIRREKKALGYSVQQVSGDELAATRQANVLNALRGKAAGVQINSGGGAPGQGTRIIIRGIKSLDPNKDNQPLFIIDGIQMDNSTTTVNTAGSLRGLSNRAADINPDDIESISILRGGAATALYGQAGSNGVVLITTKSAKAGKMRIGFSTTYGIDQVNKFPDVQFRFSQGQNSTYNNQEFFPSWGPTVEAARALDPTHPEELFHHYARGYQQGDQFRTSLNLSGGTENALVTASGSYFKQSGVIPNSDFKTITARVGAQLRVSNKIRFNPSVFYTNSGGLRVNADRFNESLTYWSPRWDVKDYIKPDGTMKYYGTQNNPIYATKTNNYRDDVNRIIANGELVFSPISWLDVNYRLGMDLYTDFRRHTAPGPRGLVGERQHEDNGLGFVNEDRLRNRIITSNVFATIKKDFGAFNTVVRAGNEVRDRNYTRLSATGSELDVPTLLSINNAKVRNNSEYLEQYRIVSAYGDVTVGYSNYLFLNLTARNDWSSTLPSGFNSFFYPSASLSWVFSDNFKLPSFMSFGKLRASLAGTGKDTDPYQTSTVYTSSIIISSSQVIWSRGDSRGDDLLRPERTTTVEAGAELRFLRNRVGLDFNWYKLNSRDQIIPVAVSPTTGFGGVIINAGEIENRGIEVAINGTPVDGRDFKWDVNVNFGRNRNKVVSIREGLPEIVVGSHFGYSGATATLKYIPGAAVGNIYGTAYQRYYGGKPDDKITVDRSLPIVIAATGTNAGFPVREPVAVQRLLGNSQPDWVGGITNTFSYKGVSLSFLWETQQGLERYNQLGNFMSAFGIAKYTEDRNDVVVFPGVLPDGSPNTQRVWKNWGTGPDGRVYSQGFYRNIHRTITENFVEDASWVRLRNLSVGYSLPSSLFRRMFVKDATVTFTGNNLLLFTNYSGYDPESSSFAASTNLDGFAGFTYPAVRSYLVSVNLNF